MIIPILKKLLFSLSMDECGKIKTMCAYYNYNYSYFQKYIYHGSKLNIVSHVAPL